MSHVFIANLSGAAAASSVVIDGDEGHHAVRVRRVRVGETVDLVDGEGTRAKGQVSDVAADSCTVLIHGVTHEPRSVPELIVIQALVKKDRSDQAIELLTEAGVDEVVPWQASRSQTSDVPQKWTRIARESSKQARRARFPIITSVQTTAAVSDRIADIVNRGGLALLCHESATVPITDALAAATNQVGAIAIVIGPEGGLASDEMAAFTHVGAVPVVMGSSVMRAATAGAMAAAIVSSLTTRWKAGVKQ